MSPLPDRDDCGYCTSARTIHGLPGCLGHYPEGTTAHLLTAEEWMAALGRALDAVLQCETCSGSGATPEDHGAGMVEYLGCQDCAATGRIPL